jgi:hypothetical protein
MLPDFITLPIPMARLMAEGGVPRLCDDLAAGQTLKDIATRIGATRGQLVRFIATLPADSQAAIREADSQASTAMVEEAKQIADGMAEEMAQPRRIATKDGDVIEVDPPAQAVLAAAKMQIDVRQWMAERKDKETWGGKAQTEITVNLASIHLDVLRKRASGATTPIAVIEPPADVSAFL